MAKKRSEGGSKGRFGLGSKPVRRVALYLALVVLLGPVLGVLPLRFIEPPATMMMLSRAMTRWKKGKTPYFPERHVVPLESMSRELVRAAVASEDGAFFVHHGFDLKQIEEAVTADHKKPRGASTISQQTAKNLFLWTGRSWVRKGLEAYFTVYLELLLPKRRILELYLNLVECADGVFGVEAGARHHFHESAKNLTADQAARLVSVFPSPRKWTPFDRGANERAARVRGLMDLQLPGYPRP